METVGALVNTVLDIAGLSERSNIVLLPEHDLLLVASTNKGQVLVERIVFETTGPNAKRSPKPKRTSASKSERRDEVRKMLKDLAKRRQDTSLSKDDQISNSRRFAELLLELRRSSDS